MSTEKNNAMHELVLTRILNAPPPERVPLLDRARAG